MDNLLEFLQSDTFQQIIMTTADIIIYYAMLAPQLFSGTLLTSVSVGGGADLITDGIFLLVSLLLMGASFVGLIMDTAGFVINVGGETINMFDEFSKVNFKGGMTGLKKQLDSLFAKLEKKTGFKEQIQGIFETILGLIDTGGKLLSDFLSMIIPNDGGVIKGIIGSAINALKVAVLAGRSFPSLFDIIVDVYNQIPKDFTKLLESSKYLEEFLTNIVDGVIFFLGKVKFMGEPNVEQVAGFSSYFVVSGFGKRYDSRMPSRPLRPPAAVKSLPALPTMEDFTKKLKNVTGIELPDAARINKILANPLTIEVPSLQQLEAQAKSIISQNISIEKLLNAVFVPIPYNLKDVLLNVLMMIRSSVPALSELALTAIPITMAGIYAIEYAIKL
jgi:hypothetical protein